MDYTLLKNAGVDMPALVERLMGNEALIQRFMSRFSENEVYDSLLDAVARKDWKAACDSAHLLKGMCGNLSISSLFALFAQQVTYFRAGRNEEAAALMEEISVKYEFTMDHICQWLDG